MHGGFLHQLSIEKIGTTKTGKSKKKIATENKNKHKLTTIKEF
jgi:hypothetical protein